MTPPNYEDKTESGPAKGERSTEDQTSKEERACCLVERCRKESLDYYEEKFRQFNYFDRLYIKGAAKSNVPYGRANLELPLAFQQIEPFVSQLTETMIGEAPYISYEGRSQGDSAVAEQISNFTQYQLDTGGFAPAYIQYLRNLGKYGTSVMKAPWETEVIEIENETEVVEPVLGADGQPVIDLMTGEIQTSTRVDTQIEDLVKHDGPRFYNLPIFDFLVPRSAVSSDVQRMDWVIHRLYRTPEEILNNPNYELNRDKIEELLDSDYEDEKEETQNAGQVREQAYQDYLEQKNSKGASKFGGKIEVLEWWGNFRLAKGEFSKPCLIVIALLEDGPTVLRMGKNPLKFKFKPFVMSNDYPIEGEPYGYGELHHIKGLVEESTALRNARLDVANISLNSPWLVERQAGVNLRELYTAPNHVVLTNDNAGIKRLDMGGVTPSSVQELARIDFDIQNTTEIINPRQDVSSVGAAFGSTATGVNFLGAKANLRLLTKARLQEETFFKPLAMMLNWYNKDLLTEETFYRTYDEESPYSHIGPDAFLTEVDFKPTSNPQKLSVGERRDNMSYLLQTVAQIEKVKPGTSRLTKLLKEVYKISGFSHPEEYVNEEQKTVLQLPTGQMIDEQGQPIQVIPVDEGGNPVEQQPPTQEPGMLPEG